MEHIILILMRQRGKNRKKELKLTVKANNKVVGKPILFRLKNVPEPYPKCGKVVGYGEMTKSELSLLSGLVAKLDNFEFDLRYEVVSFTMSYPGAGTQDIQVKGRKFTDLIKKEFKSIKRGQQLYLEILNTLLLMLKAKKQNLCNKQFQ